MNVEDYASPVPTVIQLVGVPRAPRTWCLPDEPGPEVTRLRDPSGNAWVRWLTGWQLEHEPSVKHGWRFLLADHAPLTEVVDEGVPS